MTTIRITKPNPATIRFRRTERGKEGSGIPVTGFLSIEGALRANSGLGLTSSRSTFTMSQR